MLEKEEILRKQCPDVEKTKTNVNTYSVLENATGVVKANFIVNPEWLSEVVHDPLPSPGRRHPPWSYEYPGAKPRSLETSNKDKIEDAMIKSLKMKTPRV